MSRDTSQRLVSSPPQEVVAEAARLGRWVAPAVDGRGPVPAEELLAQQWQPDRGGPDQGAPDDLWLCVDIEPRTDSDPSELIQQECVMSGRRILGQHGVQALPRPERVQIRIGWRVDVAALRYPCLWLPPLAERGELVLLL